MFSDIEKATILAVKRKIRDKFASTLNDPGFNRLPTNWTGDTYLTGGAIASLIQGEEPKDWDIYFKSEASQAWFAGNWITFESGISDVDDSYAGFIGDNGKAVTSKSITMSNKISFIIMMGTATGPDVQRKTFDYLHCTPWYDIFTDVLYISKAQFDACLQKKLVVNNSSVIKPWRESKFLERGYKKA